MNTQQARVLERDRLRGDISGYLIESELAVLPNAMISSGGSVLANGYYDADGEWVGYLRCDADQMDSAVLAP